MSGQIYFLGGAGLHALAGKIAQERLDLVSPEGMGGYELTNRKSELGFDLQELANDIQVACDRIYGNEILTKKARGTDEDHLFDEVVIDLLAKFWVGDHIGTNPHFWNAFSCMNAPKPVYGFRHAPRSETDTFNTDNLVNERVYESYYGRHWLRLAMTRRDDGSLDLEMAKKGSAEFWRSHIFRQKAVWSPKLVRAFLNFQYPDQQDRKMRESTQDNVCQGIRLFIKHLVASTTEHCLDILSQDDLENLFEDLVSGGGIELIGEPGEA